MQQGETAIERFACEYTSQYVYHVKGKEDDYDRLGFRTGVSLEPARADYLIFMSSIQQKSGNVHYISAWRLWGEF